MPENFKVPATGATASTQNRIDDSAICEFCGRTGAAEFGDHKIYVDCYQSRCSCCCESECDTDELSGRMPDTP